MFLIKFLYAFYKEQKKMNKRNIRYSGLKDLLRTQMKFGIIIQS